MKKLLCVMFVLIMVLTGCSKKQNAENIKPIDNSFKAEVTIITSVSQSNGVLTKNNQECMLEYVSPKTIKGLTVIKNANGCSVKLLGIEASADINFLPAKSAVNVLYEVFNIISTRPDECIVKKQGQNYIYSGLIEDESFEVVRNKEDLSLVCVSIPTKSIEILFNTYEKSGDV